MIKVNLTPEEELVNPFWWLPEIVCAAVLCVAAFAGVYYYLGQLQQQIAETQVEHDGLVASTRQLADSVQKYDEILEEKQKLITKVAGLRAITMSKVKRYRPLILLEHLQNLRPEGLWFASVQMLSDGTMQEQQKPAPVAPPSVAAADVAKNDPSAPVGDNPEVPPESAAPAAARALDPAEITISGSAFDNLLVAEFMSTLKATQAQEVDARDLRTQVYFSKVDLIQTSVSAAGNDFSEGNLQAQTLASPPSIVNFELRVTCLEREQIAEGISLSLRSPLAGSAAQQLR